MALDRFYRLPPERRATILETAAEVFAENGYEGTSYNALLDRLKMGKSQAYYYFSDKADLFVTACAASYEDYYARVAQLPLPKSVTQFWAYVERLHLVGFEYQQSHPLAARLTLAAAQSPARLSLAQASIEGASSTVERYQEWLRLGQGLGAIRTDLPEEILVPLCIQNAATVDAWFAERAPYATQQQMEESATTFTDLLRRMLEPKKPVRKARRSSRRTMRKSK